MPDEIPKAPPVVLKAGDFDLDGYAVGDGRPLVLMEFDPDGPLRRTQDAESPVTGQRLFGRDRNTGPLWTFLFGAMDRSRDKAQADLGEAARHWRRDDHKPGEESILRFRLGGRNRLVYGRPKQFAYNPLSPDHARKGYTPAAASFQTSDAWLYDDQARTVSAQLIPSAGGGLQSPLRGTLTSVDESEVGAPITEIGGDAPAPFEAVITGPISNPKIGADEWVIEVQVSLAYDETVTINTRTMTVLDKDGGSLAGKLTRESRLEPARLAPGPANVMFGGQDASGQAMCRVTWRPTFHGF